MNKHQLLVFGLSATVLFTACKKTDVAAEMQETQTGTEWKSVSSWSSENAESTTVYTTNLEDKGITGSIAEDGLVLVYKKSGSTITALPYEQQGESSYFWYYQVSEGSVRIHAEGGSSAQAPSAGQGFRYFIVGADTLKDLESKGHSKAELMTLSYENAKALLK